MMTTYTIRNDFHNSTANVRVSGDGVLSAGQIRTVRNKLCGISGCTCGGELSQRGRQDCDIELIGRDEIRLSPKDSR